MKKLADRTKGILSMMIVSVAILMRNKTIAATVTHSDIVLDVLYNVATYFG
ncbi:MAG: hypothetical protein FWC93_04860 [Defluviitaleaceae bacterium]|nr:hypothetical protein [Defluviitaleaceae bacterium]